MKVLHRVSVPAPSPPGHLRPPGLGAHHPVHRPGAGPIPLRNIDVVFVVCLVFFWFLFPLNLLFIIPTWRWVVGRKRREQEEIEAKKIKKEIDRLKQKKLADLTLGEVEYLEANGVVVRNLAWM
jgi:hypothetical protein